MVWRGNLPEDGLTGFWHHGILCPDETVIHYTGMNGLKTLRNAEIQRTSMEQFICSSTRDRNIHHVVYPPSKVHFNPDEIAERAASRIGQRGYNVINHNCENFARWCVVGDSKSFQVQGYVIGLAGAIFSLLFGGGLLGSALTAVAAQRAWDSGRNVSNTRVSICESHHPSSPQRVQDTITSSSLPSSLS